MIVNAYALVAGFLAIVRLPVALLVLGLAVLAWTPPHNPDDQTRREDRGYLLLLSAGLLLVLNLLAWPVFYALLQSYVPQWPGVMCIYGVTQIGRGSTGLSRFLPNLVQVLQLVKPLTLFSGGAWFLFYLRNRALSRSGLWRQVLAWMIVFALLSVADAMAEVAYLVIPKAERFLDVGCCVATWDGIADRFVPGALADAKHRHWLTLAYLALNAALPLALLAARLQLNRRGLTLVWLLALLSLAVNWIFLADIAAPTVLGLPYHHCPYDLLPQAPEAALGIVWFLAGFFAIGWAWLLELSDHVRSSADGRDRMMQGLLFVGALGYLSSVVLFTIEMVLAS